MSDDALTLQAYNEMLRERFTGSLYNTAKYLLGYSDITWNTHGKMIETLEDATVYRKLIVMPRGTFKSSIGCVAYPVWRLMKNPNLRVLIDSELYTNSKNFIRELRQHFENPLITELWGPSRGPVWGEGEITLAWRTNIKKEASITASGIGATKVGQHYDLIICDDLNSNNNSLTPEACEKVIQHYKLLTSILDPGGEMVVIGTRYSALDTIGYILDNEIGDNPA